MESNTFLVFLFAVSIGILFIGSGVTGLYALDGGIVTYCNNKEDCNSGEVCCAFMEEGETFRVCSNDCRNIKDFSAEKNQIISESFVFDITGSGVQDVKRNSDYWIYILIGVVLILHALFYKKNPKQIIKKKIIKKRRKKRKR